jgi:hypothetical protein
MKTSFAAGCLAVFMLFIIPWSAYSQDNKQIPCLVLPEKEFDFGGVKEGSKITHDFVVLNKGEAVLEIREVSVSCGCSAASFDRTIPPGGEGKITLRVDTKGYEGNIHKTATVYTNDPVTPRFMLGVRALVRIPISVKPAYVRLYAKEGATITNSVEITAGLDKALKLEVDKFNLEGKVTYRIEETEKGRKFTVYFPNIPKTADSYSGFLALKTNYNEKSTITIKINGRVTK